MPTWRADAHIDLNYLFVYLFGCKKRSLILQGKVGQTAVAHLACRRTCSGNSICCLSLSLFSPPLGNISRGSLSSICTQSTSRIIFLRIPMMSFQEFLASHCCDSAFTSRPHNGNKCNRSLATIFGRRQCRERSD